MDIEYEATFENIDKDDIREKLEKAGASLVKKEFLMKRIALTLPNRQKLERSWVRVRDEEDKITMSLKVIDGKKIENQKEICLKVDNFSKAEEFLNSLGCKKKAYQETKRELWVLGDVEVTIDEWPFLEPFVEVEGKGEEEVKRVAEKLGFKWDNAIFDVVDYQYNKKYGMPTEDINDKTPRIAFGEKNPFQNFK